MQKRTNIYYVIITVIVLFSVYVFSFADKNNNLKNSYSEKKESALSFKNIGTGEIHAIIRNGKPAARSSSRTQSVFSGFNTSARASVLMEAKTQQVLYSKNSDVKLPMASTTKIITAITIINTIPDLDKKIKVPKEAVGIEGSSVYLREGEEKTYRELLYGLMLQSGNDAAVCLAITAGGSVKNFVNMMNKQAKEYGAVNSNFANPHGLDDKKHYTTAYDLALITSRAMVNPEFKKIVSTKSTEITCHNKVNKTINNKNKLLRLMDCADGVKTGYTKNAGRCFVGSASSSNMQLVCVVLNCGPMFEECKTMLENAISSYTMSDIVYNNMVFGQKSLANRDGKYVIAVSKSAHSYVVGKHETGVYEIKRKIYDGITAPIGKDDIIGEYEILYNGKEIARDNLYALNAVA